MKVEARKVVTAVYELSVGEGDEREIIEVSDENDPIVFIHGMSGLPEAFERNLLGLSIGDTFDFSISSDEGYGDVDIEAIVDFPIENFKIEEGKVPEGMLEIGNYIPFSNEEGHRMNGRVVEVTLEYVTLDFNHPLAGETLHFNGKVLAIRNANPDEIAHGHVHGHGGVIH
ncbi:FKBP-type peptidyl-prolyl cis-trans isomerase [Emticicia sp. 17c]|uniref:FKBP-type peptidyl-prolyl cis-trans isomerase n=1 Tax=Emticicia sp. 17c TaxID=3127704 RepID=UPI00301DA859